MIPPEGFSDIVNAGPATERVPSGARLPPIDAKCYDALTRLTSSNCAPPRANRWKRHRVLALPVPP